MTDFQNNNAKNLYMSSLMFGVKDRLIASFFVVFLLRLNATNFQISLYQMLTATAGAVAIFFIANRIDSSKKSFIKSIFFDRFSFLIFSLTLFFANNPLTIIILFAIYSANFAVAGILTPNYLKDSIPQENWGKVFSRNRIFLVVGSIISLILTGKFLDFFNFMFPYNFALIFLICSLVYIVSFGFLKKIDASEVKISKEENIICQKHTKRELFKCVDKDLILMVFVYSPIYMLMPIWSMYHVIKMGFSNSQIAILNIPYFIGGLLMLPFWGRLLDNHSNKKLYKLSTLLMATIPITYILSGNFYYLLGAQFISGIFSNGFDVIVQNNLMSNSKKQKYDYAYMSNYQILLSINTIIFPALGVFVYSQLGAVDTFIIVGIIRLIASLVVFVSMRSDYNGMIRPKVNMPK